VTETQLTQPEIRGHSVVNRRASRKFIIYSILIDASIVLSLTILGINLLRIAPFPSFQVLGIFALIAALYWIPQKRFLERTLGERCWQIKKRNQPFISAGKLFTGSFLSTLSFFALGWAFQEGILKHPIWQEATVWRMEPYIPASDEFLITPFFYTLGGWPKTFQGKPIFLTLPYEKGPPSKFVGHIIAHWQIPDVKVTFEGPRTPPDAKSPIGVKECLLNTNTLGCFILRKNTLERHIQEMQRDLGKRLSNTHPLEWTLKWFDVENPVLPPEDQAHGIYLSASNSTFAEDRFILVNQKGVQQTIILNRPTRARGEEAFKTLQNSIRSMRSFTDLEPGRAWVNRELENVQLGELKDIHDSKTLAEHLAQIQSLLVSRISVDPASFDSYFHLSGTSHLLSKNAIQTRDTWGLIALQNLQTSMKFANDIAPKDPRVQQMQDLWLDVSKAPERR